MVILATIIFFLSIACIFLFPYSFSRPMTVEEQDEFFKPVPASEMFSRKTAHPLSTQLMKEDFFWDPGDVSAPFGSDDGADANYNFRQWRKTHPSGDVIEYLKHRLKYHRIDFEKWHAKADSVDDTGFNFNQFYPTATANRVILACVFGQLALEGKIDDRLIDYGLLAIRLERQKDSLKKWRAPGERDKQLTKMKDVLMKVREMQAVRTPES